MSAGAPEIRVFDTAEDLADAAADWIVERAQRAGPRFACCLSGGSTPLRLYEVLKAPSRGTRFPWNRTHWFWSDERFVPHDNPRSNFHAAWQALLRHAPVPIDNIHRIPTDATTPAAAARDYKATLKRFYGADTLETSRPLFDVTLLGLGEDGHTASLFPGSPVLAETRRWVVPVTGKIAVDRITLTIPVLGSSHTVAFLVVGEHKRDAMARARQGDPALPTSRLQTTGTIHWFADRAAAAAPAMRGR